TRAKPATEASPASRAAPPGGEPPAAEPVTAHLRAELPAYPVVAKPATLTLRLSRKKLAATAAMAGLATTFLALADRRLTVQVVPKTNVKVRGSATDSFELPAGGGSSELTFTIVPQHAGMLGLSVLVRDGAVPLAMLSLTVEAVGTAPDAAGGQTVTATATMTRDATEGPDLDSLLQLEILETDRDGDTVFQYTVRLPEQGLLESYESAPLKDREGYVVELFRDIGRLWADHGDAPAFLRGLQDRGAQLFDELFPAPLRRLLWQKRDALGQMLLIADEPYLPWELVHLKPEGGPRRQTARFLGQLGLVRWQFAGFPRATLRARKGKVWSLCPQYLDPAYALAETAQEAAFLTDKLGANPVTGDEAKVRSLLRKGGFDVLHFAGHGVADPTDVAAARVLLAGREVKGKVTPQYLTATTVAQNARLRDKDGNGPLVVLNACQTGRGGQQLSSFGGFAKAFIEAGAAAYISSLWSVGDAPARDFVETLYDELLAGRTIGEAAIAAREAARTAGDATWLAYVVYARPDARLVIS
ncbi:MAG: CHAT domain-containing protein, partial [Dermatophilaceae bacterium]